MNPPQKKKYTKFKKKRKPTDLSKYKKRIIIIASLLLFVTALSVGLGIFLNWYFVDTKYDWKFRRSGLSVPTFDSLKVSKQSVDNVFQYQKKELLYQYSSYTPVTEGVIAEGYNVTVNAIGTFVDGENAGKEYSGSKLSEYEMTDIGNHITSDGTRFLPEIQEALIGKSVEEGTTATVDIQYPENYGKDELNGRTLRFNITVVSVTKTNYPDYTDAFIKAKTGIPTVEEYESELRAMVERELAWSTVVANSSIEKYPQKYIEQYKKEADEYYKAKMESENLTFNAFLTSQGFKNEQEYNEAIQSYAEGTVKEEMVLYRIVKDERIRISKSEYETGLKQIAAENDYTDPDKFEKDYGKDLIMRTLLWDKVKEYLHTVVAISE